MPKGLSVFFACLKSEILKKAIKQALSFSLYDVIKGERS